MEAIGSDYRSLRSVFKFQLRCMKAPNSSSLAAEKGNAPGFLLL